MRFIVILVNKLPDIEKSLYQEVVDVINQIFEMLGTDVCIAALIATTYFAYGQPYVMKALTERCLRAAEETLREAEVAHAIGVALTETARGSFEVNVDLQPVVSMLLNPVAHRYQLPKVSVPDARIAATILTTYYLYDQTLTVWTVANECLLTMDTIRRNEQDYERPICLVSRRLLSGLMRLLLDIDDDPAWRVENADDEVNGLSSNYKLGQHCLFLLAQNRERNTYFANSFSDICPIYLADPDWRKPHAALITLAQFAEGCGEEMVRILDPVNLGSNSFRILNVRVQWATLKLISQLLTKQHPDLRHQQQYYQRVRPVLIGAMNDASDTEIQDRNPMVQDDALTALVARSKKEGLLWCWLYTDGADWRYTTSSSD